MKKYEQAFLFRFSLCAVIFISPFFSLAQITALQFVQNDSLHFNTVEDSLNDASDNNYFVDGSGMLKTEFEVRIINALFTENSVYNVDLFRNDADIRVTSDNLTLQPWYKISNRINASLLLNWRSLRIGSNSSSVIDVLRFQRTSTSNAFLRYIAPQIKILLYNKKFRLTYQTTFYFPFKDSYELSYKDNLVIDNNFTQWYHQLFYNRKYSSFFSLNMELDFNYRFNKELLEKKIVLKGSVTPYFNYNFTSYFKMYCFLDLNPAISGGFFSTFNLREGVGVNYKLNAKFTFDLLYTYIALGKRAQALNGFTAGGKYNF